MKGTSRWLKLVLGTLESYVITAVYVVSSNKDRCSCFTGRSQFWDQSEFQLFIYCIICSN